MLVNFPRTCDYCRQKRRSAGFENTPAGQNKIIPRQAYIGKIHSLIAIDLEVHQSPYFYAIWNLCFTSHSLIRFQINHLIRDFRIPVKYAVSISAGTSTEKDDVSFPPVIGGINMMVYGNLPLGVEIITPVGGLCTMDI